MGPDTCHCGKTRQRFLVSQLNSIWWRLAMRPRTDRVKGAHVHAALVAAVAMFHVPVVHVAVVHAPVVHCFNNGRLKSSVPR